MLSGLNASYSQSAPARPWPRFDQESAQEAGAIPAGSSRPPRLSGGTKMIKLSRLLAAAAAPALLLGVVAAPSYADDVVNNIDATIDPGGKVMPLNVGGTNGTMTIYVQPRNGDNVNGCNVKQDGTLVLSVTSSNPSRATVSSASITLAACGEGNGAVVTVTPVSAGSTTVSVEITSNNTGGTFNLAPGNFHRQRQPSTEHRADVDTHRRDLRSQLRQGQRPGRHVQRHRHRGRTLVVRGEPRRRLRTERGSGDRRTDGQLRAHRQRWSDRDTGVSDLQHRAGGEHRTHGHRRRRGGRWQLHQGQRARRGLCNVVDAEDGHSRSPPRSAKTHRPARRQGNRQPDRHLLLHRQRQHHRW